MKATHPIYRTEQEALAAKQRLERLGGKVSQPYQDQDGQWRLTVLHYGQ